MSAEVFMFEEFAGSGRGLLARPVLPQNRTIVLADVQTIEYDVYDLTSGGAPVSGVLNPVDVMFAAAQPWDRDPLGYTFLWPASGTLWPNANRRYRIVVTFTATPLLLSARFLEVWEVRTKSPTG